MELEFSSPWRQNSATAISQAGWIHIFKIYFFNIHFNVLLLSIFVSQCGLFPSDCLLNLVGTSYVYISATCPTHLICIYKNVCMYEYVYVYVCMYVCMFVPA
jgi:hypothetical protein